MAAAPALKLQVSSRLMEDLRPGTALTGHSQLIPVQNGENDLEVFFLAQDGAIARVFNLARHSASPTGWAQTELANDFDARTLAAAQGHDGRIHLLAAGGDTQKPEIHRAARSAAGSWGPWQRIAVPPAVPKPSRVAALLAVELQGKLEGFAVLSAQGRFTLWRLPGEGASSWQRLALLDRPWAAAATIAGSGPGVLISVASSANPVRSDLVHLAAPLGGAGSTRTLARDLRFSKAAVGRQAGGCSGVFLYDDEDPEKRTLRYLDGGVTAPSPAVVASGLPVTAMAAADAAAEPLTLFLIDAAGALRIVRPRSGGGWHPPLPIGPWATSLAAGNTPRRCPEVLFTGPTGELQVMWHGRGRTDGAASAWRRTTVSLPVRKVERLPTYTCEVRVTDADGMPRSATDVRLFASRVTSVGVAGGERIIGPDHPAVVRTDGAGRLTVTLPTRALDAPNLAVAPAVGAASAATGTLVPVTDHVRGQIGSLSPERVRDLLPEPYKAQAGAVHQALQRALSLRGAVDPAALVGVAGGRDGWSVPIAAATVPEQRWELSVTATDATFRDLTPEEAERLFVELASAASEHGASAFEWLADLAHAIAHGAASAVRIVVEKSGDLIKLGVDAVIAGLRYVYSGVVHLVEQAFQVVETVLHSVGVFFDRLLSAFGWLFDGAREDIWRTKKVLEGVVERSLPEIEKLALRGEVVAHDYFSSLKKDLEANFEALVGAVGKVRVGHRLTAGELAGHPPEIAAAWAGLEEHGAIANWLFEKLVSPHTAVDVEFTLADDLRASIEKFTASLGKLLTDEVRSELDATAKYLADAARHPESLAQRTLAEVLRGFERLLLLTLDLIDAVVRLFLDVVIAVLRRLKVMVLDRPFAGFFLEEVYNLFNPGAREQVTVARLIALVAAFPATVLYRVIHGRAPFTADETEALLEELAAGESPALAPSTAVTIAAILRALFWSLIDTYLDAQLLGGADEPKPPKGRARLVNLGLANLLPLLMFVLAWPGGLFRPLSFKTPLEASRNAAWLSQALPLGWNLLVTLATLGLKTARANPVTSVLLSLCGVVVEGVTGWRTWEEAKAGQLTVASVLLGHLGPLPVCAKFCSHVTWAKPVPLVVDLVANLTAGIAQAFGNSVQLEAAAPT